MEKRKRIAVAVGFLVVLFFMTASVYAEWKEMGEGECLGVGTWSSALMSNESWIGNEYPGANSIMLYRWGFFHIEAAMETINIFSNIVQKDKSLYRLFSALEKHRIDKKADRPFEVEVDIIDNGYITIILIDKINGKVEYWFYK